MQIFKKTLLVALSMILSAATSIAAEENAPPNILWITAEDHGPHLGAYGDAYAHTPNIDAFATRSLRYDVAWSEAPVCAPARTAIITGVAPTSTGGQHMRSDARLPDFLDQYPKLLRNAGYYCTNNYKEDYNVSSRGEIWNESSRQAHYKNREDNQPFFAVFNLHDSHESRIRDRTDLPHHDPAEAPIPPYHPDTPEVRRDWAQYYNGISNIDSRVGKLLDELEASGLAEDTIVFFYSDHGSGMPRHKRWPYNSGLHVPMIVHVPEKFRHLAPADYEPGGNTRRPVAFTDLTPTLLSLTGAKAPEWMQGRPFMGKYEAEPRTFLFGFRGRMDERFDMVRSVRNDRFVYIRNYMPHLIYGQYLAYMFQTETTQIWQNMYRNGELEPPQTAFWEPKPAEELYDLERDPHEIDNLADSPDHQDIRAELRNALRENVMESRDAGFLSEAEMHRRAGNGTIYEMAQNDDAYPLERIFETAELAAGRDPEAIDRLLEAFGDSDPAVRYWAALGVLIRGDTAFEAAASKVRDAVKDANPSVRIVAADILIQHGEEEEIDSAVETLIQLAPPEQNGAYVAMAATSVLADLDRERLAALAPILNHFSPKDPEAPDRPNDYVHRHITAINERLQKPDSD